MSEVDERRVRTLNDLPEGDGSVLYVMGRDQRVADNWALLYAQECAIERGVPLIVLFAVGPMFLHGSSRHIAWLIHSLKDVERGLAKHNFPFFVEVGDWVSTISSFVTSHKIGLVVLDHNPLRPIRTWRDVLSKKVTIAVHEVDAHNIVPVWEASDKQEFAAHTFRPKIHKKLDIFLTEFPKLKTNASPVPKNTIDWEVIQKFRTKNSDTPLPSSYAPGEQAAKKVLKQFISERLPGYADGRNDPNADNLSNLSPYLRWGNISAQRVALAVKAATGIDRVDKEAFLEELIVRRELSDNFVFYNKQYDKVAGAHSWAQKTIREHAKDKREHLYTYKQLETGKTHDDLWNAAQMQMVREGKMHGYLRMYWAKRILEWTPDAQTAIDWALKLNDTYELDGRDPNGVVGVMWSICGVHDRAWFERPIFGKVRYMNYNGARRKFDVDGFIKRYLGTEALFDD